LIATIYPCIKIAKLDRKDGSLDSVQPTIAALELVIVLVDTAMVGDHAALPRQSFIIARDGSAIAIGAQVLSRIETERSSMPDGTDTPALVFGAMRLRAVFDKLQARLMGHFHERIHVTWMAVEMDRDDGNGSRCNATAHIGRVEGIGDGVHIRKHHLASATGHRLACGD